MKRQPSTLLRILAISAALLASVPGGTASTPAEAGQPAMAFRHPGILNNKSELDFIKAKVAAGTEPWKTSFAELSADPKASLTYITRPRAVVECGGYSIPNNGCTDEREGAQAAYAHALIWYVTGKEAHARKAVEILNAWSAVLKDHTNSNAPLQAGWAGSVFPRAAEIIRFSYSKWTAPEAARFSAMLDTAYVPRIRNGAPHPGYAANWWLTITEALMSISVFNEDSVLFAKALGMWRGRMPAAFYISSDGELPIRPPGSTRYDARDSIIKLWHGQDRMVDGLGQETCRDIAHTQYGIAAAAAVAEIAYHQGVNLYAEEAERLTKAMEFHADLILGAPVPSWLCEGKLNLVRTEPTWEIAYNHYHGRLGRNLPLSKRIIEEKARPTGATLHMVWESMTHAELGNPGGFAVGLSALHRRPSPHVAWILHREGGAMVLEIRDERFQVRRNAAGILLPER